mgnify:CR=1 FL=1
MIKLLLHSQRLTDSNILTPLNGLLLLVLILFLACYYRAQDINKNGPQ